MKMLRVTIGQLRNLTSSTKSVNQCYRLKEKVAIVTASTAGIGFSIARRFAREGAKVIISSRREENVKKAVEELKGEGLDILFKTNVSTVQAIININENKYAYTRNYKTF